MRRPLLALLLLAPLLAGCPAPDVPAEAAFVNGRLAFVAPNGGEPTGCWQQGAVIGESLRPAWQFSGPGTGTCGPLFPLIYGDAPAGTHTEVAAAKLEPRRLYLLLGDVTGEVSAAFALSRAGGRTMVRNVDPDSPAAAELRRRWWSRGAAAD